MWSCWNNSRLFKLRGTLWLKILMRKNISRATVITSQLMVWCPIPNSAVRDHTPPRPCTVPPWHYTSHEHVKIRLPSFCRSWTAFVCVTLTLLWQPLSCVFPGVYYGITIAIVSLATAMTSVTLNLHHKGHRGTEVPVLVKRIFFGFMAKILGITLETPDHVDDRNVRGVIKQYSWGPGIW